MCPSYRPHLTIGALCVPIGWLTVCSGAAIYLAITSRLSPDPCWEPAGRWAFVCFLAFTGAWSAYRVLSHTLINLSADGIEWPLRRRKLLWSQVKRAGYTRHGSLFLVLDDGAEHVIDTDMYRDARHLRTRLDAALEKSHPEGLPLPDK